MKQLDLNAITRTPDAIPTEQVLENRLIKCIRR